MSLELDGDDVWSERICAVAVVVVVVVVVVVAEDVAAIGDDGPTDW